MKRHWLALLALSLIAAHGGEPTNVTQFSAADEATYAARFQALVASFKTGVGLDRYDLLAPVAGGHAPALTVTEKPTIAPATLAAARDFAAASNSSALLIYRHGQLELEQYFGDTARDTLLNAKSFAKPLTAITIGRAIQLGKIASLDTPVANYITEWRDDPVRSKILVRHLLDMRSGLLPQAAAMDPANILNRAYLHPRHTDIIIRDYPLTSVPGERYDYSNATAELVAPLIERATGQRYEDFIAKQVLQPLGAAGGAIWLNRPGGTAHSGCCILLPAQSWLWLAVLLLNDGKVKGKLLLPPGFVAEMRDGTPQNPHYGLGVWIAGPYVRERGIANPDRHEYTTLHGVPYAAADLFLFDGNANQVSYIVPSEGLVIVRMGAAPPKTPRWDNSVLPNLVIGGIIIARGTSIPQQ